jgi:hypothetical protein
MCKFILNHFERINKLTGNKDKKYMYVAQTERYAENVENNCCD